MYFSYRDARKLFFISGLLILASFPWLPGGDPLNPLSGTRAYVEFGLTALAVLAIFFWWPGKVVRIVYRLWWILLPGIWSVLSALWSPDPLLSLGKATVFLATLFAASALALSGAPFLLWIRLAMCLLSTFALFGIILNVLYYGSPLYFGDIGSMDLPSQQGRQRLVLAAAHPLVVGHLFALLGLFSIVSLFLEADIKRRLLSVVLFGLAIVGVVLADARASFVGLLLGVGWLFALKLHSHLNLLGRVAVYVLYALIGTLSLTWATTWEDVSGLWVSATPPDFQTLNGRIPLWQELMRELTENSLLFLLGTGFAATRFLTYDLAAWQPGHTHNGILEILVGTGMVGLLLSLPLLITLLFAIGRFPVGPFAAYLLLLSFFNPTLQGGFVFFLAIVTVLIHGDNHGVQGLKTAHPLPATRR